MGVGRGQRLRGGGGAPANEPVKPGGNSALQWFFFLSPSCGVYQVSVC